MNTQICLRLRIFLGLCVALVAVTRVSPATVTYDGRRLTSVAYDSQAEFTFSSFADTEVRSITRNCLEFAGSNVLLAAFGKFRAAEGAGALTGSIRNVNPAGGTMNCVNCAVASDATLAGYAASVLPGGPTSISVLENAFGGTFQPVSGQMQIGSVLSQRGNGARGIVFRESMSGDVGHVFNVQYNNVTIPFLDGQIDGIGLGNFKSFQNFQFLLTHTRTP